MAQLMVPRSWSLHSETGALMGDEPHPFHRSRQAPLQASTLHHTDDIGTSRRPRPPSCDPVASLAQHPLALQHLPSQVDGQSSRATDKAMGNNPQIQVSTHRRAQQLLPDCTHPHYPVSLPVSLFCLSVCLVMLPCHHRQPSIICDKSLPFRAGQVAYFFTPKPLRCRDTLC